MRDQCSEKPRLLEYKPEARYQPDDAQAEYLRESLRARFDLEGSDHVPEVVRFFKRRQLSEGAI